MQDHTFPQTLSFQDVLLLPGQSNVFPKDVHLNTRLSTSLKLKIPLISAAMDTVTEAQMAISMAQSGGLGVVHRNFTIEQQVQEIRKVKKSESGLISDPITISPNTSVAQTLELMMRNRISGIPVVEGKKLVGIITNRDLQFEKNHQQPVSDIMTRELVTAKEGISLEEAKDLLHQHRIEKLLVVDDEFCLKGLITIKDIKKNLEFPNSNKDAQGRLKVGAAVGTGQSHYERAQTLIEAQADVIVVDTAHGHSEYVIDFVKRLRKEYADVEIIAGNIATAEACKALISAGVNAVKVGIGPGSICTTRIVAGIGVPQLSAILDVASVAKKAKIPVIADGGIRYSGDIVKALAAGASSVMIGSLFAGTDEAPGEEVLYQGRTYKSYRGMGSIGAMRAGSADRYFQDHARNDYKFVPEGVEGRVPYKGSLSNMIHQLLGGVRAGLGYIGAKDIESLQEKAKFVRITDAGLRESHVHDITVTKETPNYRS
ncbi:MAG: IMP dehydrogenase [Bdellovibrionales bacterium]|nr:IMP dehydrogenase [Bdellovibrionales bacterium]